MIKEYTYVSLGDVPVSGVVFIVNEGTKEGYIISSVRLVETLGKIIQDSKENICKYKQLNRNGYTNYKIILLEDTTKNRNRNILQYFQYTWKVYYQSLDYTIHNKILCNYKIKLVISNHAKVYIKLITSNYKILYVKYFDDLSQAQQYLTTITIRELLEAI